MDPSITTNLKLAALGMAINRSCALKRARPETIIAEAKLFEAYLVSPPEPYDAAVKILAAKSPAPKLAKKTTRRR